MFGLSSMELLIIVILALIFVGPDQLPKVARTLGKGLRQFRGAMDRVDGEVRRAVREASAEFDDLGRPIRESVESAMREGADEADLEAKSETSTTASPAEANADANPVPAPEDSHSAFKPAANADPASKPKATPEESNKAFAAAASKFAERDWSQIGKRPVPGQVVREPSPLQPPVSQPTPVPEAAETSDAQPTHVTEAAETSNAQPTQVTTASAAPSAGSLPIGHTSEAELLASLPEAPAPDSPTAKPSTEDKA